MTATREQQIAPTSSSEQPVAIQYYRRAFGRDGIQTIHEKHLQMLLNGENVDLEVLNTNPPNPKIFSIRYNDAGRLLLTLREIDGQLTWLVLEDLPTHDYKKARFLRRGVLARFLQVNVEATDSEDEDSEGETDITARPLNEEEQKLITQLKRDSQASYHPIDFIGGKLAEFNAKQKEALKFGLPQIIDGHAGSGKTFVAEGLLEQYSQQLEDKDIIYLAESEALVEKMRMNWLKRPLRLTTDANVKFMTYLQFAAYIDPNIAKLEADEFVGKDDVTAWLNRQWDKGGLFKNLQRTFKEGSDDALLFEKFITNKDKLYEEFRIMSGYASEEKCQELGEDESLLPSGKQRTWAWAGYCAYLKTLKGKFNRAFCRLSPDKTKVDKIGAIIVDEALDLSCMQIRELLSISFKICFLNGSLQNLQDRISNRSYQDKLIGKIAKKIPLNVIKRYSLNIKKVADIIEEIRRLLHGGVSNKKEVIIADVDEKSSVKGEAYWQADISPEALKAIMTRYKRNEFAIVTRPEFKEEAKKIFGDVLVFNFDDVKGLEFPVVMGYRLLDGGNFASASSKLADIDTTKAKSMTSAPKKGKADDSYDLECNNLYTAITRTTGDFIFAQECRDSLQHLTTKIKSAIQQPTIPTATMQTTPKVVTPAEWYNSAIGLFDAKTQAGQSEAIKIRNNYLDEEHQRKFDAHIKHDAQILKDHEEKKDLRPAEPAAQQAAAAPQPESSSASSPKLLTPDLFSSQIDIVDDLATKAVEQFVKTKTIKQTAPAKPANKSAAPQPSKSVAPVVKPKCEFPNKISDKTLTKYFKNPDAIESLFMLDKKNKYPIINLLHNESNIRTFLPVLKGMAKTDQQRMLQFVYDTEVEVTTPCNDKHAFKKIKTEKGCIFAIMTAHVVCYPVLAILLACIDVSKPDEFELLAEKLKSEYSVTIDRNHYSSYAFMKLALNFHKRDFLMFLITNYKALIPYLSKDHLYKKATDLEMQGAFSPCDLLIRTEKGCKLLSILFTDNKELIGALPDSFLFEEQKFTAKQPSTVLTSTYFTRLMTTEYGSDLLSLFFKNRPDLIKFITAKLLSQSYPSDNAPQASDGVKSTDKSLHDPNYIAMMSGGILDWIIVELFMTQNNFLTEFYNHYLFSKMLSAKDSTGKIRSHDVLSATVNLRACTNKKGELTDIFMYLLENKDPDLLFKLDDTLLFNTQGEYDESIFCLLIFDEKYHPYLLKRVSSTPQILGQLNIDELLSYNYNYNSSPLQELTETKDGIILLKLILQHNQDALEALLAAYNEVVEDDKNYIKIAIDTMAVTPHSIEIRMLLGIQIKLAIELLETAELPSTTTTLPHAGHGLFEVRMVPLEQPKDLPQDQQKDQEAPSLVIPKT